MGDPEALLGLDVQKWQAVAWGMTGLCHDSFENQNETRENENGTGEPPKLSGPCCSALSTEFFLPALTV